MLSNAKLNHIRSYHNTSYYVISHCKITYKNILLWDSAQFNNLSCHHAMNRSGTNDLTFISSTSSSYFTSFHNISLHFVLFHFVSFHSVFYLWRRFMFFVFNFNFNFVHCPKPLTASRSTVLAIGIGVSNRNGDRNRDRSRPNVIILIPLTTAIIMTTIMIIIDRIDVDERVHLALEDLWTGWFLPLLICIACAITDIIHLIQISVISTHWKIVIILIRISITAFFSVKVKRIFLFLIFIIFLFSFLFFFSF